MFEASVAGSGPVEVGQQAWTVYQQMIALIDTAAHGIPDTLVEIRTLARTLKRRAVDLLMAFVDEQRLEAFPLAVGEQILAGEQGPHGRHH